MQIFLDTANIDEIEKWLKIGILDGVTTNPSIILKDNMVDLEKGIKQIAALIDPCPISVEVTTNDLNEMINQACKLAKLAPNIIVKIPQETEDGVPCYGVMRQLENEKIKINATVALSFGQVILSAKTGATYISIFSGRIGDEGGNASEVISSSVDWLERWSFNSKIIIGSIRAVSDILQAAIAGAHIITIPPELLMKMADHRYTRDTVKQFISDAVKSQEIMRQNVTERH